MGDDRSIVGRSEKTVDDFFNLFHRRPLVSILILVVLLVPFLLVLADRVLVIPRLLSENEALEKALAEMTRDRDAKATQLETETAAEAIEEAKGGEGAARAYVIEAHQRNEAGDPDGAIAAAEKAIALNPESAIAFNNWGFALKKKGDYDGAIEKYKKAIALDPEFATAFSSWGSALQDKGDYDAAIEKYKKAIALNPESAIAFNNWGSGLNKKGDYDAAIDKLNKATQLDAGFANPYSHRGDALRGKGERDSAIAQYEKAIELDPAYPRSYAGWGETLAEKRDLVGAIRMLRIAIGKGHRKSDSLRELIKELEAKRRG